MQDDQRNLSELKVSVNKRGEPSKAAEPLGIIDKQSHEPNEPNELKELKELKETNSPVATNSAGQVDALVPAHSRLLVSNSAPPDETPARAKKSGKRAKREANKRFQLGLMVLVACTLSVICAVKDYPHEAMKVAGDWAAANDNSKLAIQLFALGFGEPPGAKDASKAWSERYWKTIAHIGVLKNLAMQYTRRGDYPDSLKYWNEIIRLKPDCSAYYSDRGITNWFLNSPAAAKTDFESAYKLSSNDPAVLNNLAGSFLEEGDLKQAKSYLEQAIKLSPDVGIYYANLGDCYSKDRDWDRAMDCYVHATDRGNRKAWGKRLLARAARGDGRDYQRVELIMCEKYGVKPDLSEPYIFDWSARETPEAR